MTTHRRHDDNAQASFAVNLICIACALVVAICFMPTLCDWAIAAGDKLWAWMDWVMTTTENFHAR